MKNITPLFLVLAFWLLSSFTSKSPHSTKIILQEDHLCQIFVPNIFSPNEDGVNDIFQPQSNCALSEYELQVFNRWGRQVFLSKNVDQGWDGRAGGELMPPDVYVYLLSYAFADSLAQPEILSGDIAIIRWFLSNMTNNFLCSLKGP